MYNAKVKNNRLLADDVCTIVPTEIIQNLCYYRYSASVWMYSCFISKVGAGLRL